MPHTAYEYIGGRVRLQGISYAWCRTYCEIAEQLGIFSVNPLETKVFPAYQRNEGKSLLPLMLGETEPDDDYAITTFGMNNHGIRSDKFRYIQYEDGGE